MDFCATIESHEVFRRFVKCLQSLARLGQDDIGFLVTKRALYLVTENSSATCKALCTFPATVFHTFEYTVNTHSALVNSTQGCTVQNLDSSECVTLESAFRIKSKALTSIRWSETKDHFCRITVRGIEASNKGLNDEGITVVRSRHKKDLRMKLDIKSESGIAKSYQLPCLVPMGTARLVRNILTPNNSRSEVEEEKSTLIELAMGVRLLRTIIMDTIDPRAEDFMLVVRDNTVVFKGVTLEIKDETGQLLNRPRSTSIKVPMAKFSRFFGFKGTQIQLPLKPLRVLVGLAAGLFLGNGAMRGGLADSLPQDSNMSTLDLDDEPHQFEVELLSSNTGAKTRIQNKCFHKDANSGEFQFMFDFASKRRADPHRESMRIEHGTGVSRPPPLSAAATTTTTTSYLRNRSEDFIGSSSRSSNNSFGKLIGRSFNTPHGSENSFFTPEANGDSDLFAAENSAGARKRSRTDENDRFVSNKRLPHTPTINSAEPSSGSAASGAPATTNEDEENYFRHARDELPKLATLSHRPHLYHFDAHDPAPGPSIGWGEPPKHANDNSDDKNDPNDTGDNNYVEEDHDEEEQEEKEETPAQLLSTRPVLHDLGNSGIGPTQQSTFAKGIFD